MNKRIQELAEQAKGFVDLNQHVGGEKGCMVYTYNGLEKFAELIVRECYQHCKGQLMDKKLAEEAGLDYNDGVMDCAIGLKQHFGVEE